MRKKTKPIFLVTHILLIFLSSCKTYNSALSTAVVDALSTTATIQSIRETARMQTQLAVPSTTPTFTPSPTLTITPTITSSPTMTFTPSPTPIGGGISSQLKLLCTDYYDKKINDFFLNPYTNSYRQIRLSGYYIYDIAEDTYFDYIAKGRMEDQLLLSGIDPEFLSDIQLRDNWIYSRCCTRLLAVAPDGKSILIDIYSDAGNDKHKIYWLKKGKTVFKKVFEGANGYYLDPHISKETNKVVVFMIDNDEQRGVYLFDLNDGLVKKIYDEEAYDISWANDGVHVTFSNGEELRKLNVETLEEKTISKDVYSFAWSPDGSKIIYKKRSGIYLSNKDGSNETELSELNDEIEDNAVYNIDWAPNGEKVIFLISKNNGTGDRYQWIVWDLEKNTWKVIASTPGVYMVFRGNTPEWSPDGNWFVNDFVVTNNLVNPKLERSGGGVPVQYLCNINQGTCKRLSPTNEDTFICKFSLWNNGLDYQNKNSMLDIMNELKGKNVDYFHHKQKTVIENIDIKNWQRRLDYWNPIFVRHPFKIDFDVDWKNGDFAAITLAGKLNTPHSEWWSSYNGLYIAKSKDQTWLEFIDGWSENSSTRAFLDAGNEITEFTIVFHDRNGKVISVVDKSGNPIKLDINGEKYEVLDITKIQDIHLPNGVFPNGVMYSGYTLPPESSLIINQLDLIWTPKKRE